MARVGRIERQIRASRVGALVQDLLERTSAVGGPEDSALLVRPVWVPENGDEQAIGIFRIDDDLRNLLAVAKVQVRPGPAGVGGLVDPVPRRQVRALQPFPAPDINDSGIGRRDGDRAHGSRRLPVEDRRPRRPVVGALPHAAVHRPDVEQIRLAGHAGGRLGPSAAIGTDVAPAELLEERRIGLRRQGYRQQHGRGGGQEDLRARHPWSIRGSQCLVLCAVRSAQLIGIDSVREVRQAARFPAAHDLRRRYDLLAVSPNRTNGIHHSRPWSWRQSFVPLEHVVDAASARGAGVGVLEPG